MLASLMRDRFLNLCNRQALDRLHPAALPQPPSWTYFNTTNLDKGAANQNDKYLVANSQKSDVFPPVAESRPNLGLVPAVWAGLDRRPRECQGGSSGFGAVGPWKLALECALGISVQGGWQWTVLGVPLGLFIPQQHVAQIEWYYRCSYSHDLHFTSGYSPGCVLLFSGGGRADRT